MNFKGNKCTSIPINPYQPCRNLPYPDICNGIAERPTSNSFSHRYVTITLKKPGRLGNHLFRYASLVGIARRNKMQPALEESFPLRNIFKVIESLSVCLSVCLSLSISLSLVGIAHRNKMQPALDKSFPLRNIFKVMSVCLSLSPPSLSPEAKKQQNLQLLDILACNSANKPSFQNSTKRARPSLRIPAMYEVKNSPICNFWTFWPVIQLKNACPILKRWLSTKISRSAAFALCILTEHAVN